MPAQDDKDEKAVKSRSGAEARKRSMSTAETKGFRVSKRPRVVDHAPEEVIVDLSNENAVLEDDTVKRAAETCQSNENQDNEPTTTTMRGQKSSPLPQPPATDATMTREQEAEIPSNKQYLKGSEDENMWPGQPLDDSNDVAGDIGTNNECAALYSGSVERRHSWEHISPIVEDEIENLQQEAKSSVSQDNEKDQAEAKEEADPPSQPTPLFNSLDVLQELVAKNERKLEGLNVSLDSEDAWKGLNIKDEITDLEDNNDIWANTLDIFKSLEDNLKTGFKPKSATPTESTAVKADGITADDPTPPMGTSSPTPTEPISDTELGRKRGRRREAEEGATSGQGTEQGNPDSGKENTELEEAPKVKI